MQAIWIRYEYDYSIRTWVTEIHALNLLCESQQSSVPCYSLLLREYFVKIHVTYVYNIRLALFLASLALAQHSYASDLVFLWNYNFVQKKSEQKKREKKNTNLTKSSVWRWDAISLIRGGYMYYEASHISFERKKRTLLSLHKTSSSSTHTDQFT